MEKIKQVMDMIENPEKYSETQIDDILQDDECRQTYLTMMEIRMAYDKKDVEEKLDLDQEWKRIKECHYGEANQISDVSNVRLGMPETVKSHHFSRYKMVASFVGVLLLSGVAFATIHTLSSRQDDTKPTLADTTMIQRAVSPDTLSLHPRDKQEEEQKENFHKTFDNVALSGILSEMAKHYGVAVEFHNQEAKQLRFYYEWNSGDKLQYVLDELNHSQQVSLSLENGIIIVE